MNVSEQEAVVNFLEKAQEKVYLARCLLSDCDKDALSKRADVLYAKLFQLVEDVNDPMSLINKELRL